MQSELACNNVSKCCFVIWEKEKRMAGLLMLKWSYVANYCWHSRFL